MTDHHRAAAAIERLVDADDAFVALEGPIEAGRPWPEPAVAGEGPESDWGPLEVLGHVAEMLGYWLGQMERVIAAEGESVPMGRSADDPMRTAAVAQARHQPTRQLLATIRSSIGRYVTRLPELSADDWERRGIHPRLGEMTVAEMLERFVLSHLDEHAAQLGAALEGSKQ